LAVLPSAAVPLWQLAQPVEMPAWLKPAPRKLVVEVWQVSQAAVVATWVADLPSAMVPLWQVAQPDEIPAWFIAVPANVVVLR